MNMFKVDGKIKASLGGLVIKNANRGFLIIEPTGKKRLIQDRYFNQMIVEKDSKHYYAKEMPKDYFSKAELLKKNGWHSCFNYNYWTKETGCKNFYLPTNKAIKLLKEKLND